MESHHHPTTTFRRRDFDGSYRDAGGSTTRPKLDAELSPFGTFSSRSSHPPDSVDTGDFTSDKSRQKRSGGTQARPHEAITDLPSWGSSNSSSPPSRGGGRHPEHRRRGTMDSIDTGNRKTIAWADDVADGVSTKREQGESLHHTKRYQSRRHLARKLTDSEKAKLYDARPDLNPGKKTRKLKAIGTIIDMVNAYIDESDDSEDDDDTDDEDLEVADFIGESGAQLLSRVSKGAYSAGVLLMDTVEWTRGGNRNRGVVDDHDPRPSSGRRQRSPIAVVPDRKKSTGRQKAYDTLDHDGENMLGIRRNISDEREDWSSEVGGEQLSPDRENDGGKRGNETFAFHHRSGSVSRQRDGGKFVSGGSDSRSGGMDAPPSLDGSSNPIMRIRNGKDSNHLSRSQRQRFYC